jgi:hypothetical protein
MEAASTSETSATTRLHNPDDSHLHTHRCEGLKSKLGLLFPCASLHGAERQDGIAVICKVLNIHAATALVGVEGEWN